MNTNLSNLQTAIPVPEGFIRVSGHDLVDARGRKFFIRGTNLGNWLNPEGYMFGMRACSSAHFIDEMFKQLVGPARTRAFWRAFKDNYVTEADIAFIAATGSNTVRLPFHYKLFTDEDYLDLTGPGDGFRRLDDAIGWCRGHGLRVVLDMHDCPGGNTGDNIDDSHGYPWLFAEEAYQRQYCDLWKMIAAHYADDPTVLGFDLVNEPISSRLKNFAELNEALKRVQFQAVDAIRAVDKNHIVILAGAQWNGNFSVFTDFDKDPNMMYECHHYDFGNPEYVKDRVAEFAAFRDKCGKPMYMGETGHNTDDWCRAIREDMERQNIGWTFWPYKMPGHGGWNDFAYPEGWQEIVSFADGDRRTYASIQENVPDRARAFELMAQYAENCKAANCRADAGYLAALGLTAP